MIRTKVHLIILVVVASALTYMVNSSSILVFAGTQIEAGVVKVSPRATRTVEVGSWFLVNVTATDIPPVYGLQVQLVYNPNVLNATDVLKGNFLNQTGMSTFEFWNQKYNFEATPPKAILTYAETLTIPDPTKLVGGSGVLCIINFTVLSEGVTTFELVPYGAGDVGTYFLKPSEDWTSETPDYDYIIPEVINLLSALVIICDSTPN